MLRHLLRNRPALPDVLLEASVAAAVEAARAGHALADRPAWRPGEPLKLLLVGYLGTRNTGADVRVFEMIRQLRVLLGEERVELTALTSDARLSAGAFPGVRQVHLPDLYPAFLVRETARHHGVVACEGSMFKSKFANALTALMVEALGLAAARNQLAVGYGAEAGEMDPVLRTLVARYCRDALVICRNEPSREVLEALGVPTAPGTDTAWTFAPAPHAAPEALLARAGWDGRPLLAVCPINPFWWPVRPRLGRALLDRVTGAASGHRYRSLYYHSFDEEDARRYRRYLEGLADGVAAFAREGGAAVALVGMERLDRGACEELAGLLADRGLGGVPRFVSDEHDMHELVALLRRARYLVSSRYHAVVCSMPAGVPSLGVSMDERIANLMEERGQPELCLGVEDPDLGERVLGGLRRLDREAGEVRRGILVAVRRHLRLMGDMGRTFEEEVRRRYPGFEPRPELRTWRDRLPPLAPETAALLDGD